MLYQRKHLADGALVGPPAELPAELRGLAAESLADLSWTDAFLGYRGDGFFPDTGRTIKALAFKQRLTAQERIAIRAAAASNPIIADFLDLLASADTIDLDHADTVNGCAYLVAQELLTAERAAELRA